MTVKIVTDSTADLPPDLMHELDITVVPACVIFGNKTYRDGVDISQEEVYLKMVNGNIRASTSQPPPVDFANVYRKLLKDADEIVSIQATSKLSGLYNSALQGRDMAGGGNRIVVVDSLSVSMGLGLQAILAARLAKAKSLLGSVLPIKAILTMREGELHPTGAVRTRAKGIERLVDNFKKAVNVHDAAVVYSTTPDDARTLKDRISAISGKIPVHISRLGPALGIHGGPGTLVLTLMERMANLSQGIKEGKKPKKHISLPSFQRPNFSFARL